MGNLTGMGSKGSFPPVQHRFPILSYDPIRIFKVGLMRAVRHILLLPGSGPGHLTAHFPVTGIYFPVIYLNITAAICVFQAPVDTNRSRIFRHLSPSPINSPFKIGCCYRPDMHLHRETRKMTRAEAYEGDFNARENT